MTIVPYWISGPWLGKLAIVPRPRGGDWLEDEIRAWQGTGLSSIVSLLTPEEEEELELLAEKETCESVGVRFDRLAVEDRCVPNSTKFVRDLVERLEGRLVAGENVGVHCRQGIGRSSLFAACVLASAGWPVVRAFAEIERARGRAVPDTDEQRRWVEQYAKSLAAAPQSMA